MVLLHTVVKILALPDADASLVEPVVPLKRRGGAATLVNRDLHIFRVTCWRGKDLPTQTSSELRVNGGVSDVGMPQPIFDNGQISTGVQHMCGDKMLERMSLDLVRIHPGSLGALLFEVTTENTHLSSFLVKQMICSLQRSW